MVDNKKLKKLKEALTQPLSGVPLDIQTRIQEAIHDRELDESLDKWIKNDTSEKNIKKRDLSILQSVISEYMDSYIIFGYSVDGERVIVESINSAKDHDAMLEFLNLVMDRYHND
jgi:hypothetical protein